MTTSELFIQEIEKLWEKTRQRDDLIFENIEIALDAEARLDSMKEEHHAKYMKLVSESSVYEKKKQIRSYFWDEIIGTIYENTLDIMKDAGLLEEALQSFDRAYKIENTAREILENGIFADFSLKKKKELTENVINITFYPASFKEKHRSLMESEMYFMNEGSGMVLEENTWDTFTRGIGHIVRGTAYQLKNLTTLLSYALISPAALIGSVGTKVSDVVASGITGRPVERPGMNPSMRKAYELIDSLSPINQIFKFLRSDLHEIGSYLVKVNGMEDDYIQDILKETGANSNKIVQKCWDKNKHQMPSGNTESSTVTQQLIHLINGAGLANALRSPLFRDSDQVAWVLKQDAGNPTYQKMFFDFRVCVYDKLFEIILGFAKAIYSQDDASYEVVKAGNEAHKTRNFKAFFDLKPKQANEEAMFKIMKTLVAIDSIAHTLEGRKRELQADKYMDRFTDYLRQNIKQVYQQLDEMANQRKYNLDRYQEEQPDDETKAKTIAEERFKAKKSIFDEQ